MYGNGGTGYSETASGVAGGAGGAAGLIGKGSAGGAGGAGAVVGPVVTVGGCSVTARPVGREEVLESAEPVVSAELVVTRF